MKAYRKFVVCAALLLSATIGVATASEPVVGQEATEQVTSKKRKARESRLERLTRELNLTTEQRGQVYSILREEKSAVKLAKADTSMPDDVRKAKRREITAEYNARIRNLLSEEQQLAFDAGVQKKRRSRS